MSKTFEDYVDHCRDQVSIYLRPKNGFFQYIRDRKGRAKGVVTVYKEIQSNEVKIGWSLCNKLDHFNRLVGLNKALARSINVDDVLARPPEVPHTVKPIYQRMLHRAKGLLEVQKQNDA